MIPVFNKPALYANTVSTNADGLPSSAFFLSQESVFWQGLTYQFPIH